MPIPSGGVYAASKATGEMLALSLSKAPGVTETDGLVMPSDALDHLIAMKPLGRLGQPVDVASAVAFLVGPDGSWITGQVLQANGGIL